MTKAVLTTKVSPAYDDLPEVRYHFPRTYLRQVEAAVGDWIIYYEPRRHSDDPSSRGGRQCYFGTARLDRVEPDPARADHFYGFVSQYLEFPNAVPFRDGDYRYERALTKDDGSTNKGAMGRAVRLLSDNEFDLILRAGFVPIVAPVQQERRLDMPGFAEEPATFERPLVERLTARLFRDETFARVVKSAYDDTCAMTGLKIINGGGRAEVQAAHIRPIADRGPDSARNGIALSATLHWMFDRGLLSVDDDFSILVAGDRVPDTIGRMLNPDRRLRVPRPLELQPHRQFLQYHRDHVFKG